jgi:two-component system, response regulator PdtaR
MNDNQLNRKQVLIVEDEAIIAMSTADTLSSMGYEVVGIAGSGEKAIELADSLKPDLVLMDIRLNGNLDGITTASIIQNKIEIPIVFVSAHLDQKRLKNTKLSGRYLSIKKPIDEVELITVCIEALSS